VRSYACDVCDRPAGAGELLQLQVRLPPHAFDFDVCPGCREGPLQGELLRVAPWTPTGLRTLIGALYGLLEHHDDDPEPPP